jgi:hypothetical protein
VSFADLDPEERRLLIVGYLAERPPEPGPKLPDKTLDAIPRAQVALCSDLSEEEREAELEAWHSHLDGLEEAIEDEARYRLACFVQLLDPLRPAAEEDEP